MVAFCTGGNASLAAVERRLKGRGMNTVYLPGQNQRIQCNNGEGVLLRLGDGDVITDLSHGVLIGEFEASGVKNLTVVLKGPWSAEMMETLRDTRLIALGVTETWTPATIGPVLFEEVAWLWLALYKGNSRCCTWSTTATVVVHGANRMLEMLNSRPAENYTSSFTVEI
ncbi:hypothetical protein CORC01_00691 [Colletotrichum orchidophilum]|uniref:Uncharacterized protein n=1 Tax=Colletotrichum orchidophilum TaxID=1209926 RepID=A0A1G4BQV3_9PEZI|nr:uncharacterized protein CORC01_00691 [Colletotrichum orchidophilum]OHF03829.1 hypothetical protein CORC01_00691 [Colletotrichum orchidophilum]